MKNTLIKTCIGSAVAAACLVSVPASAMDILARVISSTPVVQQVAVPRQVCSHEAVVVQAPRSGAGALMGAIAGGAAGNAIGNGGGRAAATMIGLVGGAMLGDRIEGPNNQLQNVQRCSTQTFYENRASYFNVVYEYQGTQYSAQMPSDPGLHVRLNVTPVGAIEAGPQPFQSSPQSSFPPVQVQPQPVYVQPQPVYVQPVMMAPVYEPAYYAPRPYYAPYYPPIGLSLNFGYSRGFGGGHRGHWR
ncbi:Putative exported protein [Polaromonas sp. CG9_12]|nr:Putative exported protein [Polaromonas sp. CG9_12]